MVRKAILLIGLLTLVFGVLSGWGRLLVWFFLPGVQGMLLGGTLGYLAGALLQRSGQTETRFGERLALTSGMLLLFYAGQVLVPALLIDPGDPLFLPGAILDGHFREVMTGASINSFTVRQGPLTPIWWIVFQTLDMLLFLVFAIIFLGVAANRTGTRILPPLLIVAGLMCLVLASTTSLQRYHTGLLHDWYRAYGGGLTYLHWRERWVDAGLAPQRVEDFLEASESVSIRQIPGIGVLRALGLLTQGKRREALEELRQVDEALAGHPGRVRVDLVRRVSARAMRAYVAALQRAVITGTPLPASPGKPVSNAPYGEAEWFPYVTRLPGASR